MYNMRIGASDMFVSITRKVYHVTLTAPGSKQCKGKQSIYVETNSSFCTYKCGKKLVQMLLNDKK